MANVLFCANHPGSYRALAHVLQEMKLRSHHVAWVTEFGSVASEKLDADAQRIFDSTENARFALLKVKPDVLVAGVSSGGRDLTLTIAKEAQSLKIPVVKVLDFYGTGMPHEKQFAPDRLCVLDEASVAYEMKMRKMPRDRIVVTGAPQYDELLWVRPLFWSSFPSRIKKSQPFVLFVSPSTTMRTEELLEMLVPCIEEIGQALTLGILLHPRLKAERYIEEVELRLQKLPFVDYLPDTQLRQAGSVQELIASSRLVIASTSSEVQTACYLRKNVLSVVPFGGYNYEVLLDRGIRQMPTSASGASLHVGNQGELHELLEQLLVPSRTTDWKKTVVSMQNAQAEHYTLDGKNTARVVAVVESLL